MEHNKVPSTSSTLVLVQPEVVERRPAVEAFHVVVRQELLHRHAPVQRPRSAVWPRRELGDGPVQPRGPGDVGVAEARHGHPRRVPAPVGQHPVLDAPEPPVADQLEEVADVHDEGAGDVGHVHPPSAEARLQAAAGVRVLQQHGQEAGVRVRAAPQRELRLRARRVVVAHDADPLRAPDPGEAAALQPQGLRQQRQQPRRQGPRRGAVLEQRAPDGGRQLLRGRRVRCRRAEEGVAPVGRRRLEQVEVGVEPQPAPGVARVVGPLRPRGRLVEPPHRRQRLGQELAGHAVVDELEEPHLRRRGLHLGHHLRSRPRVRRREVDDRDADGTAAARGGYLLLQVVVAEDGGDGRDAGVHEALDAGLGVVERLELAQAVVGTGGFLRGGRHRCRGGEASWMDRDCPAGDGRRWWAVGQWMGASARQHIRRQELQIRGGAWRTPYT
ncbi:hypothetical protein GQ55_3G421600 [Panicum hallii var. hallii]|uniref:Uncharacterized protein n=1 Tax=Panicum hallii var. hallii TaxID=1504633 RepID=A0A2T7EHG4_9POAL|nr:hypothetical protein GQ55_3G421600 [Panicum hallii var. hallii]